MKRWVRRAPLLATLGLVPGLFQPASAGDCWAPTRENPVTGYGDATTAKRYAPMRRALLQVEAAQRSDPGINAISRVRYQVHRYIGIPAHPGAPLSGKSAIMLHKPGAWAGRPGDCQLKPSADRTHFASLTVALNNLTGLSGLTDNGLDTLQAFFEPALTGHQDGAPIFENRILVMTAGNVPAFVPVTVGEYLDHWNKRLQAEQAQARKDGQSLAEDGEWKAYIQELRKTAPKTAAELQKTLVDAAHLATEGSSEIQGEWAALQRQRAQLTKAQRAQPVYLSAEASDQYRFGYAQPGAEGARKLVKINPALWAGKPSVQAVRVVTLEVFLNRPEIFQTDDDAEEAEARAWLKRAALAPYRRLFGE